MTDGQTVAKDNLPRTDVRQRSPKKFRKDVEDDPNIVDLILS